MTVNCEELDFDLIGNWKRVCTAVYEVMMRNEVAWRNSSRQFYMHCRFDRSCLAMQFGNN